jgi:hypothetical protein
MDERHLSCQDCRCAAVAILAVRAVDWASSSSDAPSGTRRPAVAHPKHPGALSPQNFALNKFLPFRTAYTNLDTNVTLTFNKFTKCPRWRTTSGKAALILEKPRAPQQCRIVDDLGCPLAALLAIRYAPG